MLELKEKEKEQGQKKILPGQEFESRVNLSKSEQILMSYFRLIDAKMSASDKV